MDFAPREKDDPWHYGDTQTGPVLVGLRPAQPPQPVIWRSNVTTGERQFIIVDMNWTGDVRQHFLDNAAKIQSWMGTR